MAMSPFGGPTSQQFCVNSKQVAACQDNVDEAFNSWFTNVNQRNVVWFFRDPGNNCDWTFHCKYSTNNPKSGLESAFQNTIDVLLDASAECGANFKPGDASTEPTSPSLSGDEPGQSLEPTPSHTNFDEPNLSPSSEQNPSPSTQPNDGTAPSADNKLSSGTSNSVGLSLAAAAASLLAFATCW